ncbi:hypothetical protein BT63DRAFT_415100 [Microthyrium microscopicum]|uniref:Uncharacterized protein n=1 Tax=Microthyrium microscopicum TaxID=703497 RepID=A0A6A6U7C1_9PEZI|nr:hypothetical protein BT63DRAFT_415100 [Microthyrium microscopicum]
MVSFDVILHCLCGYWAPLNITAVNSDGSDASIWPGHYPSGMVQYTPDGYYSVIAAPNDTDSTLRPKGLVQGVPPIGDDANWATVGKYSMAKAGTYSLSNITAGHGHGGRDGLTFEMSAPTLTATNPQDVGSSNHLTFTFSDNCKSVVLVEGRGTVPWKLYYDKLPKVKIFADEE